MNNQTKLVDLELQLLKMWSNAGVEEIYKYKNRIKEYRRPGLTKFELFYDLTSGTMFKDVEDTANGDELYAEDCKVSVESLIKNREMFPTIKPGDEGLYNKYTVINNETGKQVDGACFVLRPDRDTAAYGALLLYAKLTSNTDLAMDLTRWLSSLEVGNE